MPDTERWEAAGILARFTVNRFNSVAMSAGIFQKYRTYAM